MGGWHINAKELFAVWVAVRIWGSQWVNKQIVIFTDNEDTVKVWYKGSTKEKDMMKILRRMFFFTATHNINLILKHISGKKNVLSDPLSCLQVHVFKQRHPTAEDQSTAIPSDVWDL